MNSRGRAALLAAAAIATGTERMEAQFHAKQEAKIAGSEKAQNAKGGTTFQANLSYAKAYEGALNFIKREGYTIDSASSESGQIVTAMDVKGGYTQTGSRVQVTCIKESETQTSVRVAITQQKRKKLLQTEPWGDAKVNEAESAKMAEQIKNSLGESQ